MTGYKGDVRPLEVQLEEYIRKCLVDIEVKTAEIGRQMDQLSAKRLLLHDMRLKFINKEPTNG